MNLRLALYELAATHGLDRDATTRLFALAGLGREPAGTRQRAWQALALLAAALVGLGLVLWVAAHWDSLGPGGRFALLQAVVLVMCAGAWWRPGARAPLGLIALLATGALFAHFGQTYQTGADAWTLFALWAALTLPLALAVRHDAVWAPWALVAAVAVALWVQTHTGHRWRVLPDDLLVHAIGWGLLIVLTAGLAPAFTRFTGAGPWALRTAATLTAVMLTLTAIGGLLHQTVAPHYGLALLLLGASAAVLTRRRAFEVFVLSAVALCLDTLLVAGLARLLFEGQRGDALGSLTTLGLAAAALLAGSVHLILKLARRFGEEESP